MVTNRCHYQRTIDFAYWAIVQKVVCAIKCTKRYSNVFCSNVINMLMSVNLLLHFILESVKVGFKRFGVGNCVHISHWKFKRVHSNALQMQHLNFVIIS